MPIDFQKIQFLKSAAMLTQLPQDTGSEVAFVGRSNAGKSSALNAIAGIKKLAKVSNTPGRTQLINIFQADAQHRLVDLPGYGFAAVPQEIKLRWQQTLAAYLEERASLRGLILLMDSRHPMKDLDENFVVWSARRQLPLYILLTKADKLSHSAGLEVLRKVASMLETLHPEATCQLFSATHKIGIREARDQVERWLK